MYYTLLAFAVKLIFMLGCEELDKAYLITHKAPPYFDNYTIIIV